MTSIIEVIQHYQRSIDSSQDNGARLLHCINKLYKLPIKVEHLQETGVGKTVNSLRKFNGEIGVAAKALVTKWKAMVAAEEEPMDATPVANESETHNDTNGDSRGPTPHGGDYENHNHENTSHQHELGKPHSKDDNEKQKEKHRNGNTKSNNDDKDSSRQSKTTSSDHQNCEKSLKHSKERHRPPATPLKEKCSSSSSGSHRDKERDKDKTDQKSNTDKHKRRDHDKEKNRSEKEHTGKHKSDREQSAESSNGTQQRSSSSKSKHEDKHRKISSSKEKERSIKHHHSSKDRERRIETSPKESSELTSSSASSTFQPLTKDSDTSERKRRHNSDNDSIGFKSPQPKVAKAHKSSTSASKVETSSSLKVAEKESDDNDSFDSSMGANFDDVLGMLNMPVKKSKKSLKSPAAPVNSGSSSIKDKHSTSTSSDVNKLNGTKISLSSNISTAITSNSITTKPDLLSPTAKLEPLDPSIALELPTISTNYKPMPLNQTVMDCVFNNSSSSSKHVRTLTDAEAITHGISSKTMRTKIYSGFRTGQTFQVPSLFDMCIRILQKNIDALEYTGGVPFEVLKPVLERATPQQLYIFEEYNPYLMEDSDVLWHQHVSRNYRTKKRIENESWREMFIRCQEEEERRLSFLKDSIKASQKIASAPVRKTQMAFVDSMVKPPRNILRKQEQFGTKSKLVATPASRVASLSSVTPNVAKTGDQRLKVSPTIRDNAQVSSSSIRPKKAPLMQKTLQFIRGRHKR